MRIVRLAGWAAVEGGIGGVYFAGAGARFGEGEGDGQCDDGGGSGNGSSGRRRAVCCGVGWDGGKTGGASFGSVHREGDAGVGARAIARPAREGGAGGGDGG